MTEYHKSSIVIWATWQNHADHRLNKYSAQNQAGYSMEKQAYFFKSNQVSAPLMLSFIFSYFANSFSTLLRDEVNVSFFLCSLAGQNVVIT